MDTTTRIQEACPHKFVDVESCDVKMSEHGETNVEGETAQTEPVVAAESPAAESSPVEAAEPAPTSEVAPDAAEAAHPVSSDETAAEPGQQTDVSTEENVTAEKAPRLIYAEDSIEDGKIHVLVKFDIPQDEGRSVTPMSIKADWIPSPEESATPEEPRTKRIRIHFGSELKAEFNLKGNVVEKIPEKKTQEDALAQAMETVA